MDSTNVVALAEELAALASRDGTRPVVVDLTGVPILHPLVPVTIADELRRVPAYRRVALVSRRLSARQMFRRWASDTVAIFPSVSAALDAVRSCSTG
jgi:anti-anti-sigma regulatory factor